MNLKHIMLGVLIVVILVFIFTKSQKSDITDNTFMKKTKEKKFGLLLPGCAFGSLLTQTGYIRSIFNKFDRDKLDKLLDPENTVVSACSGGHFSYPYFDGRDPFNLLGKYIEPGDIILPPDEMKVSKDYTLQSEYGISPGRLIERYNVQFSIKELKDGDNIITYENNKMLWWDKIIKIWYTDIEKDRKNMDQDYPRPDFVSSMVGIVKSKETLSGDEYKYLIYNNFNNFDKTNYNPLILDLKNGKKYNSIKYKQEMRPTNLAAAGMNLWGIIYDVKECNAVVNGYSNCYFECNDCQNKKDKKKKNLKENVIDGIIKNKIFNKAEIFSEKWKEHIPLFSGFFGDEVRLTDAGAVDLNTIIFQLHNQTQNMLFCNINSCNLGGYFGEKIEKDSFCSIINQPLFDECRLKEMKTQFDNNWDKYKVEFAILNDLRVNDNKRFSITGYTIKKLFIVNFKPTNGGNFSDTDWYKQLNESAKDYINEKNKKDNYFLQAGCQSGEAQKVVPSLKDGIIISNYTCWQMNQILDDNRVKDFFSMFN
jgi:hypothetical protein